MTSQDFIYWIKGYLAAQQDSQIKIDIEAALRQVNENVNSSIAFNLNNPNSTFTYNPKQQLND